MLKSECQCYSSQSTLCYTTSPYRLIPPLIKHPTILVSGGVVRVTSVKLYVIKSVAAECVAATFVAARTLLENSCLLTVLQLS